MFNPIDRLTLTLSARLDHWRNYNTHNLETSQPSGVPTVNNNPSLPEKDGTVGRPQKRREVGVIVDDAKVVSQMKALFEQDWAETGAGRKEAKRAEKEEKEEEKREEKREEKAAVA